VTRTTLDPLNCRNIIDEETGTETKLQFMNSQPTQVCWKEGSMQMSLVPFAWTFFVLYVIGYPAVASYILLKKNNRIKCMHDQYLRCMGTGSIPVTNKAYYSFRSKFATLYFKFKPRLYYWILLIVLRKLCIVSFTLLFHTNATMQLSMILLVMFLSYTAQVKYNPYLSRADYGKVVGELDEDEYQALVGPYGTCPQPKGRDFRKLLADLSKAGNEDMMYTGRLRRQLSFNLDHLRDGAIDKEYLQDSFAVFLKYAFNYNTVESTLLFCAILICLFGLMFASEFTKPGDFLYERLGELTLALIGISLSYYALVVWCEVISVVFPALKFSFVSGVVEMSTEDTFGADNDSENEDDFESDFSTSIRADQAGRAANAGLGPSSSGSISTSRVAQRGGGLPSARPKYTARSASEANLGAEVELTERAAKLDEGGNDEGHLDDFGITFEGAPAAGTRSSSSGLPRSARAMSAAAAEEEASAVEDVEGHEAGGKAAESGLRKRLAERMAMRNAAAGGGGSGGGGGVSDQDAKAKAQGGGGFDRMVQQSSLGATIGGEDDNGDGIRIRTSPSSRTASTEGAMFDFDEIVDELAEGDKPKAKVNSGRQPIPANLKAVIGFLTNGGFSAERASAIAVTFFEFGICTPGDVALCVDQGWNDRRLSIDAGFTRADIKRFRRALEEKASKHLFKPGTDLNEAYGYGEEQQAKKPSGGGGGGGSFSGGGGGDNVIYGEPQQAKSPGAGTSRLSRFRAKQAGGSGGGGEGATEEPEPTLTKLQQKKRTVSEASRVKAGGSHRVLVDPKAAAEESSDEEELTRRKTAPAAGTSASVAAGATPASPAPKGGASPASPGGLGARIAASRARARKLTQQGSQMDGFSVLDLDVLPAEGIVDHVSGPAKGASV